MQKTIAGFSLIELAVVLIIIGLVVVGVVGGGDMVRSATVKNIISEIQQHRTNLRAFSLQYDAWPGDFREGAQYWSISAGGDGNGRIDTIDETYRAWQHMALAELVEGSYTGVANVSAPLSKIGVNMAGSAVKQGGYMLTYGMLYGRADNLLQLGAEYDDVMDGSILRAVEVWNVDDKLDDGNPDDGTVVAMEGANAPAQSCVSSATPREYVLTTENISCTLIFWFRQ